MEQSGPESEPAPSQGSASSGGCPVCKKPYSKGGNARARSKHLSYCRKKYQSGTQSLTRRKACDGCVRAKVRCSLGGPGGGCSRCASKTTPCTYQGTLVDRGLGLDTDDYDSSHEPGGGGGGVGHVDVEMTAVSQQLSGLSFPVPVEVTSGEVSGSSDFSFSWEDLTWSNNNTTFGPGWSHMSMSVLTTGFGGEYPHMGDELQATTTTTTTDFTTLATLPDHSFQQPPSSIPKSLDFRDSSSSSSSLFERRQFMEPELELSGDLVLHILRSYPHMLASQNCLPPFIHPKYQDLSNNDDDAKTTRPTPLFAALKLAKTLLHGQRMNKRLIWGLIRTEQDRLFKEYHMFHKWELLEALQSLVVYMLLRIIEGQQEYTNFDTQLLVSITAICTHLATKYGRFASSHEIMGHMISWKDWAFFESRRRTGTAVLILNGIIQAQIVMPPSAIPEYANLPAPSPKTMWNAENETDWTACYADYLHRNSLHGMLKNCDLIELKEVAGKREQDHRWYGYADSFGLLVTLAANIITCN